MKMTNRLASGDVVTLDDPARASWWLIRSRVGTDESGRWVFDALCVESHDRTRVRDTSLFSQYGNRNVYIR